MNSKQKKFTGFSLAAISVLSFSLFYFGNKPLAINNLFSNNEMLKNIWESYKKAYVNASGRTIDTTSTQGQDITTSEGQSYTMLRSVWMSDKDTFDKSLAWTQKNLKQSSGSLFSWLYGKKSGGGEGVLTEKKGENTASDADTDIALALIFAYAKWNNPAYLASAKQIIADIWNQEVIIVNGTPYMTADNQEKNSQNPIINPSYLSPAAYRIFASVDRGSQRDWGKLVESSYRVLNESIYAPLGKTKSANLPPNWVQLNKTTGHLEAAPNSNTMTSDYGFDALRVPWRIALDEQWFSDPRDNEVLYRMSFLSQEWKNKDRLASTYSHDGKVVQDTEWPSMYGGSLGYFMIADTSNAKDMFLQKLQTLYDSTTKTWKKPLSYYDDTWAWFGMALYAQELPNLAKASVF